jgi:hypothetical protein
MRFIYPNRLSFFPPFFPPFRFLFELFPASLDMEQDYINLLDELELKTVERAIEFAKAGGLVKDNSKGPPLSNDEMLAVLNKGLGLVVYSIIPLNHLAAIATVFEYTYRYNEYANATNSTMKELGAGSVVFASEGGDRIPLRPFSNNYVNTMGIVAVVKSLSKIATEFNPQQYRQEMSSFLVQEIIRSSEQPQPAKLVDDEWLLTLNKAANEVAVDLIRNLREGI